MIHASLLPTENFRMSAVSRHCLGRVDPFTETPRATRLEVEMNFALEGMMSHRTSRRSDVPHTLISDSYGL